MTNMNDNSIRINSILLGLYLSINMLTKIITSIYSFRYNIVFITFLIFSFSLIHNEFKINKLFMLFNTFIMCLFIISICKIKDYTYTIYYLQNYIIYGLIATYLVTFDVDFKKVTLTINYIFALYTILLLIIYIPRIKMGGNLDFTMDLSYTSMIGISSVLLSIKHMKSKKTVKMIGIVSLVINIWYLLFLSNNRGAILTLLTLIFLLLISKIENNIVKNIIIFGSVILSFVVVNNLEIILKAVNIFFYTNFNIKINWLERFLHQIAENNILSGRDLLYKRAYNMFVKKPIVGNGIGYFELFNNGQYAHNIFLQTLCEHGLIISSVFIFFIVLGLIYIIKDNTKNDDIQLLKLFFVLSIPRLMISSSYWQIHFFWLYIFVCVSAFKKSLSKYRKSQALLNTEQE